MAETVLRRAYLVSGDMKELDQDITEISDSELNLHIAQASILWQECPTDRRWYLDRRARLRLRLELRCPGR